MLYWKMKKTSLPFCQNVKGKIAQSKIFKHIFSAPLKVSKSQKHFLKLPCPKNELNIRQNSALALSNILFVFCAMEFQEKMLLRLTDL